jgi:hypothetical protein
MELGASPAAADARGRLPFQVQLLLLLLVLLMALISTTTRRSMSQFCFL